MQESYTIHDVSGVSPLSEKVPTFYTIYTMMDEDLTSFLISEDIDDENMKWTEYDNKIGGLSGASFFRLQMSSGHGATRFEFLILKRYTLL